MRRLPAALAAAERACFLAGIALFCGGLAAALFDTSTRLVPIGGSLLILGWLVASFDHLKRD